jgi:hypothetical protein
MDWIKVEKKRKTSGGVGGQDQLRWNDGTYDEQACPPLGGQGRVFGGQGIETQRTTSPRRCAEKNAMNRGHVTRLGFRQFGVKKYLKKILAK